jgi:hypothetical protein
LISVCGEESKAVSRLSVPVFCVGPIVTLAPLATADDPARRDLRRARAASVAHVPALFFATGSFSSASRRYARLHARTILIVLEWHLRFMIFWRCVHGNPSRMQWRPNTESGLADGTRVAPGLSSQHVRLRPSCKTARLVAAERRRVRFTLIASIVVTLPLALIEIRPPSVAAHADSGSSRCGVRIVRVNTP